jgi:hypothetical protein
MDADLLSPDESRDAIDAGMMDIISSRDPSQFPVRPAGHCQMCNFLGICSEGRESVRGAKRTTLGHVQAVKAVEAGR